MAFGKTLRRALVLLLCLSLCLGYAAPALAADNTGSDIRLLQVEGTVSVASGSGKSYETRENMRLYNGYSVSTEEKSYAWITLDETKAVKLDAPSSLEVRRSGKELEVLLKYGNLYFNVTAPLKEEEKLNIRTSTMVTGVRGTSGWISELAPGQTTVGILEGEVQCTVTDPVSGESETTTVGAGQIADLTVDSQGEEGERTDVQFRTMETGDISGSVLTELVGETEQTEKIKEETDGRIDLTGMTGEDAEKQLTEDEEKAAEELRKTEEILAAQEETVSQDPVWTDRYTVTWIIDGEKETETYASGDMPVHADPVKAGASFIGWSPAISAVTGDAEYTAQFAEETQPSQPSQPTGTQYALTYELDTPNTVSGVYFTVNGTQATQARAGDTVVVYAEAPSGYTVGGSYAAGGSSNAHSVTFTEGSGGVWTYTFTMEAADTQVWVASYIPGNVMSPVHLETPKNGTLTAYVGTEPISDGTEVKEGTTVTFVLTPDSGFEVSTSCISSTVSEGINTEVQGNNTYTFTMPNVEVTLGGVFTREGMDTYEIEADAEGYDSCVRWVVTDTDGNTTTDLCAAAGERVDVIIADPSDDVAAYGHTVCYYYTSGKGQRETVYLDYVDDGKNAAGETCFHFTVPDSIEDEVLTIWILATFNDVYTLNLDMINPSLGSATVSLGGGEPVDVTTLSSLRVPEAEVVVVEATASDGAEVAVTLPSGATLEPQYGENAFYMPRQNCTLKVEFRQLYSAAPALTAFDSSDSVTVLYDVNDDGQVDSQEQQLTAAAGGTKVYLQVSWNSDHMLQSLQVSGSKTAAFTPTLSGAVSTDANGVSSGEYFFTLPEEDVTVTAVFSGYHLGITENTLGTVSAAVVGDPNADVQWLAAGTQVSFSAAPSSGNRFVSYTFTGDSSGSTTVITDKDYTYTMPKESVTVTVAYEQAVSYTVTVDVDNHALGSVFGDENKTKEAPASFDAQEDSTVELWVLTENNVQLTVSALSGNNDVNVTTVNTDENTYKLSFTMPGAATAVSISLVEMATAGLAAYRELPDNFTATPTLGLMGGRTVKLENYDTNTDAAVGTEVTVDPGLENGARVSVGYKLIAGNSRVPIVEKNGVKSFVMPAETSTLTITYYKLQTEEYMIIARDSEHAAFSSITDTNYNTLYGAAAGTVLKIEGFAITSGWTYIGFIADTDLDYSNIGHDSMSAEAGWIIPPMASGAPVTMPDADLTLTPVAVETDDTSILTVEWGVEYPFDIGTVTVSKDDTVLTLGMSSCSEDTNTGTYSANYLVPNGWTVTVTARDGFTMNSLSVSGGVSQTITGAPFSFDVPAGNINMITVAVDMTDNRV